MYKVPDKFQGTTTQTVTRDQLVDKNACGRAMKLWDRLFRDGEDMILTLINGRPDEDALMLIYIFREYIGWASGRDLIDLRGAYLTGAYLTGAYLRGAYLRGAYLTGAYLRGAMFISPSGNISIIGD